MDAFFKICGLNIKQSVIRILTIAAILLAFSTLGQGSRNYMLFSSYEEVYTSEDSNFLQKISYIELKANKIYVNGFTAFEPFPNAQVLHVLLVGREAHAQIKLSSFLIKHPFEKIIIEGPEGSSVDFIDTGVEIGQIFERIETFPEIFSTNVTIGQCDNKLREFIIKEENDLQIDSLLMSDGVHFFNQESIYTDQDFLNSAADVTIYSPIILIGNTSQLGASLETLSLLGNCIEINVNEDNHIKTLYGFILDSLKAEPDPSKEKYQYNNTLRVCDVHKNSILQKINILEIWDSEKGRCGKVYFDCGGSQEDNSSEDLKIFIEVKTLRYSGIFFNGRFNNSKDYVRRMAQSYPFFVYNRVGDYDSAGGREARNQLVKLNKFFELNIDTRQILPSTFLRPYNSSPAMRKNTFP